MSVDRSTISGVTACAVQIPGQLGAALDALGIPRGVPVIILIGGASEMTDVQSSVAQEAVGDGIGLVAAELGAVVVDGGTDAGVMQLAGQVRAQQGDRFALVGVVGDQLVTDDAGSAAPEASPEPRHSGIIVVPGSQWGDETPWLFDVAELIAAGRPIRTVLVNGGAITRKEFAESIRREIPVIVIRGTGRAADDLDGDGVLDARGDSYDRPLISVVEASETEGLRSMLREALDGPAERSGDGAGS